MKKIFTMMVVFAASVASLSQQCLHLSTMRIVRQQCHSNA